jgi:hypothetical protein
MIANSTIACPLCFFSFPGIVAVAMSTPMRQTKVVPRQRLCRLLFVTVRAHPNSESRPRAFAFSWSAS